MKKLYNVHVGMRFTTDILVEATNPEEAKRIVTNNLDSIDIDDLNFASDDYDVWEEKPSDYSKYYIMNENGNMEERRS